MKKNLLLLLAVVLAFVLGIIFNPYSKNRSASTTGTESQLPADIEAAVARVVNDPSTEKMATISDADQAGPYRVTGSVSLATSPSEVPVSALQRPDSKNPQGYTNPIPGWAHGRMDASRKTNTQQ